MNKKRGQIMQVKIIKKNDEYSPEYAVGDIFEVEALKKLPRAMNLIKVTPQKIEFSNSDFKNMGGDIRQSIIF